MITHYVLNYAHELWMGKWKSSVRWLLRHGPLRFSEIKKQLPDCSVKVLSQVLEEMTRKGIIIRTQYPTIPVRVTYELSPSARPIIKCMESYLKTTAQFMVDNQDVLDIPDEKIQAIREKLLSKQ